MCPCLAGQSLAQEGQAGQAVRCFTAAQPLGSSAAQGGASYDKAAPKSAHADHKFFDEDLTTLLETSYAKVRFQCTCLWVQWT